MTTELKSQLDTVLALEKLEQEMRDATTPANGDPEVLPVLGSTVRQWAAQLAAIRAAVGGEAVAWQFRRAGSDDAWSLCLNEQHRSNTATSPDWEMRALYASPPATVDVGAIRALIPTADDLSPRGDELDGVRRVGQIEMIEEMRRRVDALIGKEA